MIDNIIISFDPASQTIKGINKTYEGTVIIKKSYDDVVVKTIGEYACNAGLLKELILNDTEITTIKKFAFVECSNLEKVVFPNTLTTLELNSFGVTGITSIHLPSSVEYFSGYVVNQCGKLNDITVDEKNKYFVSKNNFVFSKDFTTLVRVPINCDLKDIPNFDMINSIGEVTFSGSKIKSFIATRNLSYLANDAFHVTANIKVIDLSLSSITTLYRRTFIGTANLMTLILPKTLTTIKTEAFSSVGKIKNIYLPESLATVADKAFLSFPKGANIYIFGDYIDSFSNTGIVSNCESFYSSTKVHVSNGYIEDNFACFDVKKDLIESLNILYKSKLICTRKVNTKNISPSLLLYVFTCF